MGIIGKINDFKIRIANISSYKQYSTDEIIGFIDSFPEPHDNLQRSYFQYKCNSKLYGVKAYLQIIRNIGCFIPFWFLFFRRGKKSERPTEDFVFISDEHKMDIMPEKYKGHYVQVSRSEGWLIRKRERKEVLKLWRKYPFSYYYLLKNLIKLANYCWVVESFNPSGILCSCEYSFTSSFLTDYCRSLGIKHINVMHGYNIVDLKCPFSTFDIMSIWDGFFTEAYKTMRCGTINFEIERPLCVRIKKRIVNNPSTVITYYTQNYVKTVIPTLVELYKIAEENGFEYKIRCHPSYPIDKEDRSKFPISVFEDFRDVSIEESLNNADIIVARNSTVLYQGVQLDKMILIDDTSLPEEYIESRKKGAFLWETNHTGLLSEFVKNPKEWIYTKRP